MTDVLLVTCARLPDGESDGHLLVEDLAARGIDARWVAWDDPAVDWSPPAWSPSAAPGTTSSGARSSWPGPRGRAGAAQRRRRLRLEHRQGLPPRPRRGRAARRTHACWRDARGVRRPPPGFGARSASRRVGAGGRGVVVLDGRPARTPRRGPGPGWCSRWSSRCAPRARSRCSSSAAGRGPGPQGARRRRGPRARVVRRPLRRRTAGRRSTPRWPRRTVAVAEGLLGAPLAYARVDLMRLADGTLAVGELEVTEPGLYLDLVPEVATAFGGWSWPRTAGLDARGRRALARSPAETPSHPRGSFRLGPPREEGSMVPDGAPGFGLDLRAAGAALHSRGASAKHEVSTLTMRVTQVGPGR